MRHKFLRLILYSRRPDSRLLRVSMSICVRDLVILLQVPKCFGLVQIFCARPKIYLRIVAVTNILRQTERWFEFSKIVFCASTKVFEEALNAVKFLGWLKIFGPAQNIFGPVKGQGISMKSFSKVGSDKILGCTGKSQIISKCFFSSRGFFQKMNKNTSHTGKNEFIRSFFGRVLGLTICFWN